MYSPILGVSIVLSLSRLSTSLEFRALYRSLHLFGDADHSFWVERAGTAAETAAVLQ